MHIQIIQKKLIDFYYVIYRTRVVLYRNAIVTDVEILKLGYYCEQDRDNDNSI